MKKNKIWFFLGLGSLFVLSLFFIVNYFGLFGRQLIYYSSFNKPAIISNQTPDVAFEPFSFSQKVDRFTQLLYGPKADFVIENTAEFKTVTGYVDVVDLTDGYVDVEITDAAGRAVHRQHLLNNSVQGLEQLGYVKQDIKGFSSDVTLYSKSGEVDTVNEIFDSGDSVLYYNVDLFDLVGAPTKDSSLASFDHALRGKHVVDVFIDETFFVQGSFFDLNEKQGPDRFNAVLKDGDLVVKNFQLTDDGNTSSDGEIGSSREFRFDFSGVKSGKYQLLFDVSDDIVIESFGFNPIYYAFLDKMHLVQIGEKPFLLEGLELGLYGDDVVAVSNSSANEGKVMIDGSLVASMKSGKEYRIAEKCTEDMFKNAAHECEADYFFDERTGSHSLVLEDVDMVIKSKNGYFVTDRPFPFMRKNVVGYFAGREIGNNEFIITEKNSAEVFAAGNGSHTYRFVLPIPAGDQFRVRFVDPFDAYSNTPEMIELKSALFILGK